MNLSSRGSDEDAADQALGRVVEELTSRLQAGELVDAAAFALDHPEHAERIRQLLPALHLLADLARSGTGGAEPGQPVVAPAEELAGTLGDFRILRQLGRGGMGVVYEAEQISLRRRVALKVLPFAAALDPRQLQRFKNEAQAAAQLHHTHIVPVFGVGCERGVYYYAMQFIEGKDLATLIHEMRPLGVQEKETAASAVASGESGRESEGSSPVPYAADAWDTPPTMRGATLPSTRDSAFFRTVARLGAQAADGLEHAHQLGVIHRDIKPANLLVDVRRNLWITDFGLARLGGHGGLTMSGDLLGTVRYMSPEQAGAWKVPIDHRSDIYSLGVTLYELTTLEPAFPGNDRQAILRRVATEEPRSPRRVNPAVPADLETILLKAMAKEPERRYATAQDLGEDLRRFLEERPIQARRPSVWHKVRKWRHRHRRLVLTAGLLSLIAVVALAITTLVVWRAQQRAEAKLALARQLFDDMYLQVTNQWSAGQPYLEAPQLEFLEKALAFYQEMAQAPDSNPTMVHRAAEARLRVGDIHQRLGQLEDALDDYQEASMLLARLAARCPEVPTYREQLADTHASKGVVLRGLGRQREAETATRRALEILPENGDTSRRDFRFTRAKSWYNLGTLLFESHRLGDAEASFRQSACLLDPLVAEAPHLPIPRLYQGINRDNLANVLRLCGRFAEAEASYGAAQSVLTQLVADFPKPPDFRYQLASSQGNLGILRENQKRYAEAEACYRQCLAILEPLAADFSRVPLYKSNVGAFENNLALVLWKQGQPAKACALMKQALIQQRAALALSPNHQEYMGRLHTHYQALATILVSTGKRAEAAAVAAELVQTFPHSWKALHAAASVIMDADQNAVSTPPLGKDEAQARVDQARLWLLAAARQAEDDPEARNQVAWSLATCPPRARDGRRAVELAQRNTEQFPREGAYWNTLGVARYRTGELDGAIAALTRSCELRGGGDSFDWFVLAMAHWQRGDQPAAREVFERAITWMDRHKPLDTELRAFRAEAAKLLGIPESVSRHSAVSVDAGSMMVFVVPFFPGL
jgi:serine/threonine protein kinase/Flp pilus assembly protein TadD